MLKRYGSLVLAFLILFSSSACSIRKLTRYEAEFLELFDTMTKIVGYSDSKEQFTKYSQGIYDDLKNYHQLYDIYHNYEGISNIKTINDNAGIKPVRVDRKIIDLLLFGRTWHEKTGGELNIACGAVLSIWHKYREAGIENPDSAELPPLNDLQEAAKHTDINNMVINEKESTVFLSDPKMRLDVGSIGKGYAAEQVAKDAREAGFTSFLLSVGGNVRANGKKADSDSPWNVGIENPFGDEKEMELPVTNLVDDSLVTSGDYERYYMVNGKRYHHIIDPDTLFPAAYFKSVTIICKDSGIADALSTSVFNMPFEEGLQFIESLSDTDALWIFKDGTIKTSRHFQEHVRK